MKRDKLILFDRRIDGQHAVQLTLVTPALCIKAVATVTLGKSNALVSNVYVANRHRRKGVAGKMIAECARIARLAKKESLSLIVVEKNKAARATYAAMGFRCVYHFDDGDDILSRQI
jgi:ribosomal protein S18 acetylase RimI-like enzyme